MKNLPNLLSLCRVLLSLLLPFLPGTALFLPCYLLCGVTDLADGWAARRFHLETQLGAKLDSIGDAVFWAVVLVLLAVRTDVVNGCFWVGAGIVALLRTVNLVLTKARFGQWGMVHTWANKATGLLLYVLLPVWVVLGSGSAASVLVLFAVALLSSLDELVILLTARTYNPNRRWCLDRER